MLNRLLADPPAAPEVPSNNVNGDTMALTTDTHRYFVLQTPEILKPVILFCTHALRYVCFASPILDYFP